MKIIIQRSDGFFLVRANENAIHLWFSKKTTSVQFNDILFGFWFSVRFWFGSLFQFQTQSYTYICLLKLNHKFILQYVAQMSHYLQIKKSSIQKKIKTNLKNILKLNLTINQNQLTNKII